MAAMYGENGTAGGDREIQLLDIIAILLKRRRLIVGLLVLALVWSLGSAAPKVFYKKQVTIGLVDSFAVLRANPALRFLSTVNVDEIALTLLRDPRFVADVLKASGYTTLFEESITDLDGDELARFVMTRLMNVPDPTDKKSRSAFVAQKETGNIRLSLLVDSNLDTNLFYDAQFAALNARIREWILPLAQAEVDSFSKYTSAVYPRQVIEQNLYAIFSAYINAKVFIEGSDPIYIKVNEPVSLTVSGVPKASLVSGILKDTLMKVIAFLIVGVLLSFLLEWFEGISHDVASMKKIKEALKRPTRDPRNES